MIFQIIIFFKKVSVMNSVCEFETLEIKNVLIIGPHEFQQGKDIFL